MTCVLVCACRLRCVHRCICICFRKVEYIVRGTTCIEIKTWNNTNAQLSSWQKDMNANRSTTTHCKKIKPHTQADNALKRQRREGIKHETRAEAIRTGAIRAGAPNTIKHRKQASRSQCVGSKLATVQLLCCRSILNRIPIKQHRWPVAVGVVMCHKEKARENGIRHAAQKSLPKRRVNTHANDGSKSHKIFLVLFNDFVVGKKLLRRVEVSCDGDEVAAQSFFPSSFEVVIIPLILLRFGETRIVHQQCLKQRRYLAFSANTVRTTVVRHVDVVRQSKEKKMTPTPNLCTGCDTDESDKVRIVMYCLIACHAQNP